ncbi:uncharacterized protein LOC116261869 [Nymphaea colorata]|nr:uncharacterized protein LOC116261869 [Nymphaea colorata]
MRESSEAQGNSMAEMPKDGSMALQMRNQAVGNFSGGDEFSLNVTHRPLGFHSYNERKNFCQPHGLYKGSPSARGLSSPRASVQTDSAIDGESSLLLNKDCEPGSTPRGLSNRVLVARVLSVFSNRSLSLPVRRESDISSPISGSVRQARCLRQTTSNISKTPAKVSRSLSVPPRSVILVRNASFPASMAVTGSENNGPVHIEIGDEEIPEDEAVCRICLIGLSEVDGNPLKLECSCKGDLALAHEECAVKWFRIRGNKLCDICGQEVQNLPVTLLRVQSSVENNSRQQQTSGAAQTSELQGHRYWHEMTILVLISTLSYFCFFEQLLVQTMRSRALVISIPSSLIVGFLASISASLIVYKEYIWAYAAFQFALVIILLHLFYSMLHFGPVIAIFTSTLIGSGTAISINALVLEFFSLRSRLRQGLVHPQSSAPRDLQHDEILRSPAEAHDDTQQIQNSATQEA